MLNKPFKEWMDGILMVEKFKSNRLINLYLANIEITTIEEEEEEIEAVLIEEALIEEEQEEDPIEVVSTEEVEDHHPVDHFIDHQEGPTTQMYVSTAGVKVTGNLRIIF